MERKPQVVLRAACLGLILGALFAAASRAQYGATPYSGAYGPPDTGAPSAGAPAFQSPGTYSYGGPMDRSQPVQRETRYPLSGAPSQYTQQPQAAIGGGFNANQPPAHGNFQPSGPFSPRADGAAPQGYLQPSNAPPAPANDLFEPATLIGIVGNQHILAGDILPTIDQMLEQFAGKMPPEQLDQQRRMLMQRMLMALIENKLLFHEFLRSLPDDKREEAMGNIRKKVSEEFDRNELPSLLERSKVETAAEFDAKLRKYGASLAKQKQAFMERQLGRAAVQRNINIKPEVTHSEMLEYYQANSQEYQVPAKAQWEQMTVLFERFRDRRQAWDAIAQMGNEVYLGGAPFAAVAKRRSQASNAESGGFYDWTSKGSLRSEKVDAAIFSLPLNQLSPIIEDDRGYHILRVLARKDASMVAFEEAQVEIKDQLRQEKVRTSIEEYVKRIRRDVYVWTIFDNDDPDAHTAGRPTDSPRQPR